MGKKSCDITAFYFHKYILPAKSLFGCTRERTSVKVAENSQATSVLFILDQAAIKTRNNSQLQTNYDEKSCQVRKYLSLSLSTECLDSQVGVQRSCRADFVCNPPKIAAAIAKNHARHLPKIAVQTVIVIP